MKPIWIGDRRDRVKWGSLVHLANRERIHDVLTVPFLRDDTTRQLSSSVAEEPVDLPAGVWDHFSNVRIERLAAATGLNLILFTVPWAPPRHSYVCAVQNWIATFRTTAKILFLDPDTGLEPQTAGLEHVLRSEVTYLWNSLAECDWLVLYQHAAHTRTWREARFDDFCRCCPGCRSESFTAPKIANDVILYAARR